MNQIKHCKYCNEEHPLTEEFWSKLNNSPICRAYKRAYDKKNYKKQAERIKDVKKVYYRNNKPAMLTKMKIYRYTRRHTDINFRILTNLRSRLGGALRRKQKSGSAIRDLGCSIEQLQLHLSAKFEPGMTWDNYGTEWHIDHIRPLANYDLTDRQIFLQLAHYTNLQPLWAADNMKKSNKEF